MNVMRDGKVMVLSASISTNVSGEILNEFTAFLQL